MDRILDTHFHRGNAGHPPPGCGEQPIQGGDMICGVESKRCTTLGVVRKILSGSSKDEHVALTSANGFDRM